MNDDRMTRLRVEEKLQGIVSRVTYHNPNNGWSVLRVEPFAQQGQLATVTVHQTKVFAGATMEFTGEWRDHTKFGRQFYAVKAIERKPASTASLEKYLGSGLIKGVGPKTARKIVKYFQQDTLSIFDNDIDRLKEVPGIASKKLHSIAAAWHEHIKIRDVMMFLQTHGISTLFAVRIYQSYGDDAIEHVTQNPYRLADDFYGIGFFSADKVALSIGFQHDSAVRINAAIKHVLAASREQGHCYLLPDQIVSGVYELIEHNIEENITRLLNEMVQVDALKTRDIVLKDKAVVGYYARSLFFHETHVADRLNEMNKPVPMDAERVAKWVNRYCEKQDIALSQEQYHAAIGVPHHAVSILTGGPGCGKTTTTLVIVRLLEAMKKRVVLVAPTGRAAQRMSEVIGREAKTVHRLLEWKGGQFQVNEDHPLNADFVIIDESSMLDISLADAIISALPYHCQLLFIGDADQLPSVGAGNVLKDLIASHRIHCFRLTEVFRQAKESLIIQNAHNLNQGKLGRIISPFHQPTAWHQGIDCLFIDSDEATKDQLAFIKRVKSMLPHNDDVGSEKTLYHFRCDEPISSAYDVELDIPKQFQHVDLAKVMKSQRDVDALKAVVKKIHPWSSLHYGLTATDIVLKLYQEWLPKYLGNDVEIQILSPMARGSLGTTSLNQLIQAGVNPMRSDKAQLSIGQRILRVGDRVIHRRNNYDLNVYNGDIGQVVTIDTQSIGCTVMFSPDNREVMYQKDDLTDLDLAYAITIHKSQGSEFGAVIIPVLTQHFKMLYRNLLYTGLTRAKKFAVFVGTRRALAMAAKNMDTSYRQTALEKLLR